MSVSLYSGIVDPPKCHRVCLVGIRSSVLHPALSQVAVALGGSDHSLSRRCCTRFVSFLRLSLGNTR